jgi:hypothetical protein
VSYPARCPGCDAQATDTLYSDPHVPIYACGWYPSSRYPCPLTVSRLPGPAVSNVDRLTRGESAELLELADALELTVLRMGAR